MTVLASLLVVGVAAGCGGTTEPSSTPTTAVTSASVAPSEGSDDLRLGPLGFGGLTLGMSKSDAAGTGLTVGVDPATPPACSGDGDGFLVGTPEVDDEVEGRLFFSDRGLVAIYAHAGIETPEGIGLGSTSAEVAAAYPDFEIPSGEPDGHGWAKVPGNPDAHYRIEIHEGKVMVLSLDSNDQNCYE